MQCRPSFAITVDPEPAYSTFIACFLPAIQHFVLLVFIYYRQLQDQASMAFRLPMDQWHQIHEKRRQDMKKIILAVAMLALGFFTAYPAHAFDGDREYRSHRPVHAYQHQRSHYHGYQYGHAPRHVYYREVRPVHGYYESRPTYVYHESRHHDNVVPALLGGVVIGTVIGSTLR